MRETHAHWTRCSDRLFVLFMHIRLLVEMSYRIRTRSETVGADALGMPRCVRLLVWLIVVWLSTCCLVSDHCGFVSGCLYALPVDCYLMRPVHVSIDVGWICRGTQTCWLYWQYVSAHLARTFSTCINTYLMCSRRGNGAHVALYVMLTGVLRYDWACVYINS